MGIPLLEEVNARIACEGIAAFPFFVHERLLDEVRAPWRQMQKQLEPPYLDLRP